MGPMQKEAEASTPFRAIIMAALFDPLQKDPGKLDPCTQTKDLCTSRSCPARVGPRSFIASWASSRLKPAGSCSRSRMLDNRRLLRWSAPFETGKPDRWLEAEDDVADDSNKESLGTSWGGQLNWATNGG